MSDWWRLYASRDASPYGQRRQYSGSSELKDFEDLKHYLLSQGFVVVCVKEKQTNSSK